VERRLLEKHGIELAVRARRTLGHYILHSHHGVHPYRGGIGSTHFLVAEILHST
jgi:hypothetical protein